jgi:hypothetical protein
MESGSYMSETDTHAKENTALRGEEAREVPKAVTGASMTKRTKLPFLEDLRMNLRKTISGVSPSHERNVTKSFTFNAPQSN